MRYLRYESPANPFDRWEPTGETLALAELRLLAPCEPTKVVALGLNYRAHEA